MKRIITTGILCLMVIFFAGIVSATNDPVPEEPACGCDWGCDHDWDCDLDCDCALCAKKREFKACIETKGIKELKTCLELSGLTLQQRIADKKAVRACIRAIEADNFSDLRAKIKECKGQ